MRYARVLVALLSCCVVAVPALSQKVLAQNKAVKIGVLDDMSGPYAENTGPGDVLAAKFAIADFGGSVLGKPIELVSADFQSKVDIGVGIAKRWYDDEDVDMVIGIPNSAIALALVKVAGEKNRIVMPTAAATSELTGKGCGPNSLHWIYDTYGQTKTIVSALTKQGGDTWFFVTVDYAFGLAIEADATSFIKAAGGKVLGSVRHPLNASDFSAYLVQAQASKAKGLIFADGGNDIINGVKQAAEFGLARQGMRISAPLIQFPDVHGLGLKVAQGLLMASPFYWDMNPQARAFSDRFAKEMGRPPSFIQAGTYSAVTHYLKAVKAAGTDEAKAVLAEMRKLPINDFMTSNGHIRADGRVIRDMYLMQVKTPEESKGEWDLAKIIATVPGDEAFRPLSDGACPMAPKH
ncbi:branched-chain amino acid transport system substrate-binding protein [Enhydrobacter aerosaccus]|uniref:Branched-chain amino acid transport system substrate-binding protein n=1 Tax=Enhydrobacter aerosaccus TaxID=225324 RepID=A0A1T4SYW3_9HYPH|nr:ABC transporter substrate-binding protein [Enhydrobacter aerosaccus]SKA33309.1 branched-chain amino acid transport system substrate-binding protein [Enhydrobacter aerosaccus]